MHKINMAMVQRRVSLQTVNSTERQDDLVDTLHIFLLLLLFLLISSLLVTMGELVMFSWNNRGRQTALAALIGEIKNAVKKRDKEEGNDEWKDEIPKMQCEEEECRADQKLLEHEGSESTKL